jgi:hypothetical protein
MKYVMILVILFFSIISYGQVKKVDSIPINHLKIAGINYQVGTIILSAAAVTITYGALQKPANRELIALGAGVGLIGSYFIFKGHTNLIRAGKFEIQPTAISYKL